MKAYFIKMAVVNVETLVEVLLRDRAVGIVQDLASLSVVFKGLADGVRELAAGIDVAEEDINLCTT